MQVWARAKGTAMGFFFYFVALFLSFGIGHLSQAAVPKSSDHSQKLVHLKYVMCKSHKIVRTIRVSQENENERLCTTTYTKAGVDRIVGSGQSVQTCQTILKNIQNNLEKADWRCRDISRARISSGKAYFD